MRKYIFAVCVLSGVLAGCSEDKAVSQDPLCDAATFVPSCADANHVTKCIDGQPGLDQCEYGCADNACRKTAPSCEDGSSAKKCEGDKLMQCADGDWVEETDCAAASKSCSESLGKCVSCQGDAKSCDGDKLMQCTDGEWVEETDCAQAGKQCIENRCESCTEGQKKCDGDQLMQCNANGGWDLLTDCGKDGLVCKTSSLSCEHCTNNERRCIDDNLMICYNESWKTEIPCESLGQICNPKQLQCVDCIPGTKKCEGNVLQVCNEEEHWSLDKNCASEQMICSEERLACLQCEPGQKQCDGEVLMQCDADGNWAREKDCMADGGQLCAAQDNSFACIPCTEGEKRCDGDNLRVCGQNGAWETETECASDGRLCNPVRKECVSCLPEQKTCDGDVLMACDDGQWTRDTDCSENGLKCGGEKCVACLEGDKRCTENRVMKCDADANWIVDDDCAARELVCDDTLLSCIACKPGDHLCGENDKLRVCDEHGQWTDGDDCAALGKTCSSDLQACVDCLPGERKCDAASNSVVACDANGAWAVESDCTALDEDAVCDPVKVRCGITSVVGVPCGCTGNSCSTVITGSDMNNVINFNGGLFNPVSWALRAYKYNTNDFITFPNFFGNTQDLSGCEGVSDVVPSGMIMGCFRKSNLDATSHFISNTRGLLEALKGINSSTPNLAAYGNKIIDLVEQKLEFNSPGGYCFVGAMDVNLVFNSGGVVTNGLTNSGANLIALANQKFDAGTLETAKTAVCPKGSVLINDFQWKTKMAGYGSADGKNSSFNMAMCLHKCLDNDDCRTDEGYECVTWHEKKVCFYQKTIDQIHTIETTLEPKPIQ